ncbi:MAG: Uma2 family endonuclease [Kamptonema sp. SIO4C4]|nr:Uma2 family endonuclease [Kamptonema sp. SIO4C4]
MPSLTLSLPPLWQLTDEQLVTLAQTNPDLRLERTTQGELIIMSPTGGETGNANFELYIDLGIWNRQTRLGKAFDSSTGFRLPNGAIRSPDVSWLRQDRWNCLSPTQRQKFLPLCPDFAIELVSETDELAKTQAKMQEYQDNGLPLGWLIAPKTQTVEIYRSQHPVEILKSPVRLSGENILPGFILEISRIWNSL